MKPLPLAALVAVILSCGPLAPAQQAVASPTPGDGARRPALVPQDAGRAEAIRATLRSVRLPPGFRIELYALVPDARMIAVGPRDGVVFVSTREHELYALDGRDGQGVAVRRFAPRVRLSDPHGICFSPDGVLFVAEQNRILAFADAERDHDDPGIAATVVVGQGELIPPAEQSTNHAARVCRVGPDNRLYVALGQPYNVEPPAKLALYDGVGMGGIIRMARDGTGREVFARGIRNSVGMDFDPRDGSLWFTDNQVDGMGDDQPPGEIDHATRPGENFGFPWYGGGHTRTREYRNQAPPADAVFPVVEEVAHAADLGMTIYTGSMFPPEYRGAIISAQHGSWNRTTPVGARVMVTRLDADGTAPDGSRPFAEGWLDKGGDYKGRPVDVEQMRDGSLLVSDDFNGAVYRITYQARD